MKNWVLPTAIWVAALAVGILCLADYETTAGARGATAARWPAASTLPREPGHPTIAVFVHARCICTRATANELAAVMRDDRHAATVDIVVIEPSEVPRGWAATGELDAFRGIPRTNLVVDRGGVEAARFGAKTSGYIAAYDADGALLFAGGITASRGHAGDNAGRQQLLAQLVHATGVAQAHDVFGCKLGGER